MSPPSFGAAARILAEGDPVIARLVAEAGPPRLSRPTESHFGTLVRAIVYQQLAGRAAAAIHGRLIAAVGGNVLPEPLLALTDEQMRAVGLSRNKMASLRDLAAKVLDGTVVLSPRGLARESDNRVGAPGPGHDGGMQKFSLEATARELLERARNGRGGRAATTLIGGHEKVLRQTVIAMVSGASLAEHESPGEASVHVLSGRVRLSAGQHSWDGRHGDLLMLPDAPHSLEALEDSAVLLTVAKQV